MRRDDRPAPRPFRARLRGPAARFECFQALEQRLAHQWVAKVDPALLRRRLRKVASAGRSSDCAWASALQVPRLGLAPAHRARPARRRCGSRSWNWRRSRAAGGPDRPAAPCGCRPARKSGPACARRRWPLKLGQLLVKLLAHAVQALELELACCPRAPSPGRWCWRCGWRKRDRWRRSRPAASWRRRDRRRRSRPCA